MYLKGQVDFESLFQKAVHAIDAGDADQLKQLLDAHPELATERLYNPGVWLRDDIGDALDSFFKDPYLLWFVSEDAVRKNTLPSNIVSIAAVILQKIKEQKAKSLQEQLDYTLKLVTWSWVARRCNVQIGLMELLITEGAAFENIVDEPLVNGNFEAAQYLLDRGSKPTLAAALCLGRWNEADELAQSATPEQKQFCLILASLHGKAEALAKVIGYGEVEINKPSEHLYSHAPALHHAAISGSLEAVKLLISAGADMNTKDTIYSGTPLDWAEYGKKEEIANYLREIKK